jgi:DNA-binding NarL/FixJ family response regulator
VSSAEIGDNDKPVPASLYRFFAEEVFSSLTSEVQQGLMTLSVAPVLDRDLAVSLIADRAADVIANALDVGILAERESWLDLHPLARAFLEEKSSQIGLVPAEGALETCLAHYQTRRDWDAAFDVVVRADAVCELEPLLATAIDDLLDAGRLPTLRRWCEHASDWNLDAPVFSLARAEALLRDGHHIAAIANAEAAASIDSVYRFRALCLAGRAAHLASREEQALTLFRLAAEVACNERESRDAAWGELLALIELERSEAEEVLRDLRSTVRPADPHEVVRASAFALSHQLKFSDVDLAEADVAVTFLSRVRDPLLISSFQSTYSAALGLSARYADTLEVVEAFVETIRRYRLDFAIPYAYAPAALSHAGLRRWSDAEALISEAVSAAIGHRDVYAHQLCAALWIRILTQQGRHHEALELETPVGREPVPSAQAELTSSRALALAASNRTGDALAAVNEVRGLSMAVEPSVLIAAVDAICRLKDHAADSVEMVVDLANVAFRRGAPDLLVTAYRSTPELLAVLLRASPHGDRIVRLVRRVGDEDLAELAGHAIPTRGDRRKTLSPREREVYELVIQGLTNREIAKLLFIEESTVKVHVHHIYDKLGVRSRIALTVQAKLERSGQATSATAGWSAEGESSIP